MIFIKYFIFYFFEEYQFCQILFVGYLFKVLMKEFYLYILIYDVFDHFYFVLCLD